MFTVVVLYSY